MEQVGEVMNIDELVSNIEHCLINPNELFGLPLGDPFGQGIYGIPVLRKRMGNWLAGRNCTYQMKAYSL